MGAMETLLAGSAPMRVHTRALLVLVTLLAGALPAWFLVALGPAMGSGTLLRWVFLFTAPVICVCYLLMAIRAYSLFPHLGRLAGLAVNLGLMLLILLLAVQALPLLVFPRLPPNTAQLVELSRQPATVLSSRAMGQHAPRQRLEAAIALYLQSGRPAMFMDGSGAPAVFQPGPEQAAKLRFPRWLAGRPGALPAERRLLAVADLALIAWTLLGLPLALRRRRSSRPPLQQS